MVGKGGHAFRQHFQKANCGSNDMKSLSVEKVYNIIGKGNIAGYDNFFESLFPRGCSNLALCL